MRRIRNRKHNTFTRTKRRVKDFLQQKIEQKKSEFYSWWKLEQGPYKLALFIITACLLAYSAFFQFLPALDHALGIQP